MHTHAEQPTPIPSGTPTNNSTSVMLSSTFPVAVVVVTVGVVAVVVMVGTVAVALQKNTKLNSQFLQKETIPGVNQQLQEKIEGQESKERNEDLCDTTNTAVTETEIWYESSL